MEFNRLIETEQRNDDLVRRAVEAAAVIVRTAQDAAQQREAAFADALQKLITANAATIAAEQERRAVEIVAATQGEVARYDAVSDAQIVAVAQMLVDDLVTNQGQV